MTSKTLWLVASKMNSINEPTNNNENENEPWRPRKVHIQSKIQTWNLTKHLAKQYTKSA